MVMLYNNIQIPRLLQIIWQDVLLAYLLPCGHHIQEAAGYNCMPNNSNSAS